jgi:hypothetical protein
MHIIRRCTLIILFTCFFCPGLLQAATPFDNFSGPRIDIEKWHGQYWYDKGLEVVREVANGKYVSRLGGISGDSGMMLNQLSLDSANSYDSFSAKVIVKEAAIEPDFNNSTWSVGAQLEGFFYKATGGDVWAGITLGFDGTNWSISYGINTSSGFINGPAFALQIAPNTEYTVSISYDGIKTITFTVNNESHTLTGPDRTADCDGEFKGLTTGIWGNGNGAAAGYISATFDDVTVNGSAYDDFAMAPIDGNKWIEEEEVREIRNGKLQMNIQLMGNYISNAIYLNDKNKSDFLQADLTISSTTDINVSSITGFVKVYGDFFNTKHDGSPTNPYDDNDGEIWAGSILNYDDSGSPRPEAYVYRCDDSSCGTGAYLFQQNFSCSTQLDAPVTLSVEKQGTTMIFHCNNEQLRYQLTGTLHDSIWNIRNIRATIGSTDPSATGYLKTKVDNVYIRKPSSLNLFMPAILSQHSKK